MFQTFSKDCVVFIRMALRCFDTSWIIYPRTHSNIQEDFKLHLSLFLKVSSSGQSPPCKWNQIGARFILTAWYAGAYAPAYQAVSYTE